MLDTLIQHIDTQAHDLNDLDDVDSLLDHVGDSRYVLLGEASHGTSEYYTWRARLTQRLIREKDFSFVAVEGDWPDCYRVNRYIDETTSLHPLHLQPEEAAPPETFPWGV